MSKLIPLEIEVSIAIPDTRTPSVPSIQDLWVGADWNEKETWDLVGIDFEGHEGMRRVLQPHEHQLDIIPCRSITIFGIMDSRKCMMMHRVSLESQMMLAR